jgi:hypothetical protein
MENFLTASKPFLFLAKFMGVFPMDFHELTLKTPSKVRASSVLISSFWFVVQTSMLVMMVAVHENLDTSKILTRAWKLLNILELSCLIANFSQQILKWKSFMSFSKKIQEIDEMVKMIPFSYMKFSTLSSLRARSASN